MTQKPGNKLALQKSAIVRLSRDEHGASVVEVDTAQLPPANRKLTCNAVDVLLRDGSLELTFAQCLPGTRKAIAALIISIAPNQFSRSLKGSTFLPRLSEFLNRENLKDIESSVESLSERTVLERAATLSIAHVGHDAEIRFFGVRAGAFVRMQAANEWTADFIDPLVDVNLSAVLLKCLLLKISALVSMED